MLATSVLLAMPGSSGLVRRSTRRSACAVPTSSAARIACGRRSRQCQTYGTALLCGSTLMPPPIPGLRDVLCAELRVIVLELFLGRLDVGKLQHLQILPQVRVKRGPCAQRPAAPARPRLSDDRLSDGARGSQCTRFFRSSETVP